MTATEPQYPVTVQLIGTDGNAFALIGKVAAALRTQVGPEASRAFIKEATAQHSYDDLLAFIQRTVEVT
jgi:hypothetical protein